MFLANISGFKQIARHLAIWLKKAQLLRIIYSRVVIITEEISLGAEREKEARKAFL
jgi:hypothetical protein